MRSFDDNFYLLYCVIFICFFFFKQKTAYEMRISDWSSDVCSSDLAGPKRPTCRSRPARSPSVFPSTGRSPCTEHVQGDSQRHHGQGQPLSHADRKSVV